MKTSQERDLRISKNFFKRELTQIGKYMIRINFFTLSNLHIDLFLRINITLEIASKH